MGATNYNIKVTAVGPIHVGNGRTLNKKDYFKRGNGIAIIDVPKFIAALSAEQLEAYCRFLKEDSSKGLQDFLDDSQLFSEAESAVAYQLNAQLDRAKRGSYQYFEVKEFVKDACGCPYIPGSSLKGMLRTVLLASIIERNSQGFMDSLPRSADWQKSKDADGAIMKKAFWVERPDLDDPQTINDIMRYVSISDSKPLSTSDLVFAKKYDKFARSDDASHKRRMGNQATGSIEEGNDLNFYRESLKPGTKIEFKMSIDDRVHRYLPLELKDLCAAIASFNKRYEECFLAHFNSSIGAASSASTDDGKCRYIVQSGPMEGKRCRNSALGETGYCRLHQDKAHEDAPRAPEGDLYCCLGGGVDFDSKTILNALFKDEQARLRAISEILYHQFPSEVDRARLPGLWEMIEASGFQPQNKRFTPPKKKDDHRHWRDIELGVSPHTLKLGKIGRDLYPMGKCSIAIERIPLSIQADNT